MKNKYKKIKKNIEFEILSDIFNIINSSKSSNNELLPIFSFEGLPGAGKTTQIQRVSETKIYGKSEFIDIPTPSSTGKLLKTLYADTTTWNLISNQLPWLNPCLLSLDLCQSIAEAKKNNAKFVLMSRGIISTYYYNISNFITPDSTFNEAWDKLSHYLKAFPRPKAVIFLDLPVEVAHARVVERKRLPFRKMDTKEEMEKDLFIFERYKKHIYPPLNVHHINANQQEEIVTNSICEVLSKYLKK